MAEVQPEDLKDIQGIVISGYGHLPCASYMLLRVTEAAAARRWLRNIVDHVTTSERKKEGSSLNVALTHQGLLHLGLDDETLATFSRPFLEGMTTPHRSRILGDADENAPANWDWGGNDVTKAVDILLLVFALDESTLEALLGEKRAELVQNGIAELQTLGAGRQPDSHEHFGFADGMGQPAIEGTIQAERAAARNVIKAGEFLLSYTNDYGKPADSPMVQASRDPNGLLPPASQAKQGRRPPRKRMRDLGRNGTYLVFRQLAQHVANFRNFLDEATRGLDGQIDPVASVRLAAKFVGRWQNGAPLALSPARRRSGVKQMQTTLAIATAMRTGFKCPIGSHVRRSNPRDTLGPDGGLRWLPRIVIASSGEVDPTGVGRQIGESMTAFLADYISFV